MNSTNRPWPQYAARKSIVVKGVAAGVKKTFFRGDRHEAPGLLWGERGRSIPIPRRHVDAKDSRWQQDGIVGWQ